GVVGISASSRIELQRQLSQLGTNMLTVSPGSTVFGDAAKLPARSVAMISRIGPVRSVSAVGRIPGEAAYRNEHIPVGQTGSIVVYAAGPDLLSTVGAGVASGRWHGEATGRYPTVVLGAKAAGRLGVQHPGDGIQVYVAGRRCAVIGVLAATPLAPEL